MTDALKAAQRADEASLEALGNVIGAIAPLPNDAKSWRTELPAGMEDDIGQRLAALRFEVNACDALQVDDLDAAAELLAGLQEEHEALGKVIERWAQCIAGGVG